MILLTMSVLTVIVLSGGALAYLAIRRRWQGLLGMVVGSCAAIGGILASIVLPPREHIALYYFWPVIVFGISTLFFGYCHDYTYRRSK
jgi:hypothetical protein